MIIPKVKQKFIDIENSLQHLVDLVDSIPINSTTSASKWVVNDVKINKHVPLLVPTDSLLNYLNYILVDINKCISLISELDKEGD